MGEIGAPAVPFPTNALSDTNIDVRAGAAKVDRKIAESVEDKNEIPVLFREASSGLSEAMEGGNSDDFDGADALEKIGGPAIPALARALKSHNSDVRCTAALALLGIAKSLKNRSQILVLFIEAVPNLRRCRTRTPRCAASLHPSG